MSKPHLPYIPNAIEFAGKTINPPNAASDRTYTYNEASNDDNYLHWGLRFYTCGPFTPPLEFTQYALRAKAISERSSHNFLKNQSAVSRCLKDLIYNIVPVPKIEMKQVHNVSDDEPNSFRGIFIRYFFKKVICNLKNEPCRCESSETYAAIFPFRVLGEIPTQYNIDVEPLLGESFYAHIQSFLDEHFENAVARQVVPLFLANIRHFQATHDNEQLEEYLKTFYQLNKNGTDWFKNIHAHYKNVRKAFDKVEIFIITYSDNYYLNLAKNNFFDLYKLLDASFLSKRERYTEQFEKYVFFFVHALKEPTNPVHFIDDVLFECLKSLHRFKTSRQDLGLLSDIAKICLIYLRAQSRLEEYGSSDKYLINSNVLKNIKNYAEKIPNIQTSKFEVEYKTDYLHGLMFLRTSDTCYEICYSQQKRSIEHFYHLVLSGVLPPESEQIKNVVIYNAHQGEEHHLVMPEDKETIRNYVRFANTYDFREYTETESRLEFLLKYVKEYFNTPSAAPK